MLSCKVMRKSKASLSSLTMKTSKASSQASTQEECGVWLDTADLKGKAKQKRPIPISKLLNPLARSRSYSLAVALNFTQTKIQMPVTKQSSISSFFTLQPKVTAKMPASPEPSRNAANITPSTSNVCTSTSPKRANIGCGIKRKRVMEWTGKQGKGPPPTTIQTSPGGKENPTGIPSEWDNQTFRERVYWERAFMPRLNMDHLSEEEMEEPEKKRNLSGRFPSPVKTGAHGKDCNQKEPLSAYSIPQCNPGLTESWGFPAQDSKAQCVLTHKNPPVNMSKFSGSETAFPDSTQSPGGFRALLDLQGHTSTQRGPVQFPLMSQDVQGKENDYTVSIGLPSSNKAPLSPVTTHRQMKPPTPSPWKHVLEQPLKHVLEQPLKHVLEQPMKHVLEQPMKHVLEHPLREAEGDTLAMLFTQDSEGFQVIAHRDVFPRSPLKDRTNVFAGGKECISAADQTLQVTEEEEEEMLFTQDSQGNMVIKHYV
ncbi:uncharacterized protein LOC105012593 isoform X1 [Esox lucius]|nr:uncharacterized protein LOC105012593 isoform X1 [Esox lucius]